MIIPGSTFYLLVVVCGCGDMEMCCVWVCMCVEYMALDTSVQEPERAFVKCTVRCCEIPGARLKLSANIISQTSDRFFSLSCLTAWRHIEYVFVPISHGSE